MTMNVVANTASPAVAGSAGRGAGSTGSANQGGGFAAMMEAGAGNAEKPATAGPRRIGKGAGEKEKGEAQLHAGSRTGEALDASPVDGEADSGAAQAGAPGTSPDDDRSDREQAAPALAAVAAALAMVPVSAAPATGLAGSREKDGVPDNGPREVEGAAGIRTSPRQTNATHDYSDGPDIDSDVQDAQTGGTGSDKTLESLRTAISARFGAPENPPQGVSADGARLVEQDAPAASRGGEPRLPGNVPVAPDKGEPRSSDHVPVTPKESGALPIPRGGLVASDDGEPMAAPRGASVELREIEAGIARRISTGGGTEAMRPVPSPGAAPDMIAPIAIAALPRDSATTPDVLPVPAEPQAAGGDIKGVTGPRDTPGATDPVDATPSSQSPRAPRAGEAGREPREESRDQARQDPARAGRPLTDGARSVNGLTGNTPAPLASVTMAGATPHAVGAALGQSVVDIGSSGQWIDSIAHQVASISSSGGRGSFQMTSPALGPVRVEVRPGDTGTRVHMMVENDAARSALLADSNRLIQDAQLSSVRIAHVQVDRVAHIGSSQSGDLGQNGSGGQNGQSHMANILSPTSQNGSSSLTDQGSQQQRPGGFETGADLSRDGAARNAAKAARADAVLGGNGSGDLVGHSGVAPDRARYA